MAKKGMTAKTGRRTVPKKKQQQQQKSPQKKAAKVASAPAHPRKMKSDSLATESTLAIPGRIVQTNIPYDALSINVAWNNILGNAMGFILDPTSCKAEWPLYYIDLAQASVNFSAAATYGDPARVAPNTTFEQVRTTGACMKITYAGPPLTMSGRVTVVPFAPFAQGTDLNAEIPNLRASPHARVHNMSDLCKGIHVVPKCLGDSARRYQVPLDTLPPVPYFTTPTFSSQTYGGPSPAWELVLVLFESMAADAAVNIDVTLHREGIGRRGTIESSAATPPNYGVDGHTLQLLQAHGRHSVAHVGATMLDGAMGAPAAPAVRPGRYPNRVYLTS